MEQPQNNRPSHKQHNRNRNYAEDRTNDPISSQSWQDFLQQQEAQQRQDNNRIC